MPEMRWAEVPAEYSLSILPREMTIEEVLQSYIDGWRAAYAVEFFGDKTDWDSLDENGKIQAQRNAAGMMRHWANVLERDIKEKKWETE